MVSVLVGMGSNIEPESNLSRAAVALRREFGGVSFSAVYSSAAVGMDGDDFYNACCLLEVDLAEAEVRTQLKLLEDLQGRDRSRGSWKSRTLDLDVLMYDGVVVDDELYRYPHAYVPAAELIALSLPVDDQKTVTLVPLRL